MHINWFVLVLKPNFSANGNAIDRLADIDCQLVH